MKKIPPRELGGPMFNDDGYDEEGEVEMSPDEDDEMGGNSESYDECQEDGYDDDEDSGDDDYAAFNEY